MISDRINNTLNEQINKEFYSGYLYLSMSAHLKELGLFGFASWMRIQAKEEVEHGLKIFDYIINSNSFVTLKQIKTPDFEYNGVISIFNIVYEHEKCITNSIMEVAKIAEEECDRTTLSFIDWFIASSSSICSITNQSIKLKVVLSHSSSATLATSIIACVILFS